MDSLVCYTGNTNSAQEQFFPLHVEDQCKEKPKERQISCDSQHESHIQVDNSTMDEEYWPLSGDKQYFHVVLSKTHVQGNYRMVLPIKMVHILPQAVVPVVLTGRKKSWEMNYNGETHTHQRFDYGWRNFVIDNDLKIGDGCVFELTESSRECIKFRVQILDGGLPSSLLRRADDTMLEGCITGLHICNCTGYEQSPSSISDHMCIFFSVI